MAVNGMNVARLNMSHGNHEWHSSVIERIRTLNKTKGCVLRVLAHRRISLYITLFCPSHADLEVFCTSSCHGRFMSLYLL